MEKAAVRNIARMAAFNFFAVFRALHNVAGVMPVQTSHFRGAAIGGAAFRALHDSQKAKRSGNPLL